MGALTSTLFAALRLLAAARAAVASSRVLSSRRGPRGAPADLLRLWAVLACLALFERTAEGAVSWLPFYGTLKLAAYAAILLPGTGAPALLFEAVLRPAVATARARLARDVAPRLADAALRGGLVRAAAAAAAAAAPARELRAWDAALARHARAVEAERDARALRGDDLDEMYEDDADDGDGAAEEGAREAPGVTLRRRR
jgi:hypothetical protein